MGIILKEDGLIDIEKSIDDYYEKKERESVERDYFYVSEISKSKKDLYKSLKGTDKPKFPPRVKRILENGDYMHQRYTKVFAEMGMLIASEIYAVENDLVHGRCDCIITDKRRNYVVELKSCSQWTFNKLTKPTLAHELQLMVYMYYLGIDKGMVLYECKDNQMIKCFYVDLDKEKVEKKLEQLRELKKEIESGNISFLEEDVEVEDLHAI